MKKLNLFLIILFAGIFLSGCNNAVNLTSSESGVSSDRAQNGGGNLELCSGCLNFFTYYDSSTVAAGVNVDIYDGSTYIMTVGTTNGNGYVWMSPGSLSRGNYTAVASIAFGGGSAQFCHDGESGQLIPIEMNAVK